jgi:single-stranded-DNA-specific exonuclease
MSHSHKILKIAPLHAHLAWTLSKELGVSKILAQVLINRNIKSASEADKFLNVSLKDMHDPYSFKGMHKAVELIREARKNKDKVMVFGDYDADGITSLALLKNTLKDFGLQVVYYLPHRIKEGYGLTKNILHTVKENNAKLLITVDCGTSNHKEIRELKRNGIKVIVTDHHEPSTAKLPEADSIINPKAPNSGYPYRDLAGVGVAYKLSQAVSDSGMFEDLDLVALGTIADSAPLTGENRIFAREGLQRISKTKRPGLMALIENAGMRDRKFNSTFVSFILAPRINASGRMSTAETSLKLLISKTNDDAAELAKIIEGHNRERQKVEGRIMQEAEDLINKEINFKEHKVIVIAKENWHQGVLGIVASKIADKFYRPAIVISLSEDLCKGSARSVRNFHLFNALVECRHHLDSFGGHAHAAGITITKNSINDFREEINRLAHEKMTLEDLLPSLDVDMELRLSDLNEEAVAGLESLEPFGVGNPEPLFYTRNLSLKGEPLSLQRETLKFWVTDGLVTHQAIGFGMSSFRESLLQATHFDLVYTPRIDSWRDDTSVILEVRDIFFR